MSIERAYTLTRIRAGDYIFPGNSAQALYRVSRYYEDGSLSNGDGTGVVKGDFWSAWRWRGGMEEALNLIQRDDDDGVESFLDWDRWQEVATLAPTRERAIQDALEHDA